MKITHEMIDRIDELQTICSLDKIKSEWPHGIIISYSNIDSLIDIVDYTYDTVACHVVDALFHGNEQERELAKYISTFYNPESDIVGNYELGTILSCIGVFYHLSIKETSTEKTVDPQPDQVLYLIGERVTYDELMTRTHETEADEWLVATEVYSARPSLNVTPITLTQEEFEEYE